MHTLTVPLNVLNICAAVQRGELERYPNGKALKNNSVSI